MSDANVNIPAAAFGEEVLYFECRHNLAASLGRVSFDGCREFLKLENGDAAGDAMLCVACGCHRSFHRREVMYRRVAEAGNANAVPAGPANPNMNVAGNNGAEAELKPPRRGRRKRTVFSPEQKNQMRRFAEMLGWRPQKSDKEEIEQFCMEMGMSRRMFLVWLSNNRRREDKKTATV